MSTTARRLTYDDLLQIPDDARRYELIAGELIELPSPDPVHQRVLRWLLRRVDDLVTERQLGEVFCAPLDLRFEPTEIVQPDLIFLSYERFGVVSGRPIDGAPDLIVEILSPSTRDKDLVEKKALYERFGVREYWTVDPEARAITVHALRQGRYVDQPSDGGVVRSTVLPGFAIDVADRFAGS